ncbi:MAG: hypothetical protein GY737_17145 [Desulfobacteraceae bacterium]|nr:hypothetical protein [Desulfobacteraceae bacterium]
MPAEVLSVAPEGALQWIRTARKELSRIVLSLRHANGDIIRVRPDSFYLTAEIAFKRRLAVTFD